jgi:hypothetical protein
MNRERKLIARVCDAEIAWTPIVPKPYSPVNRVLERAYAKARRNRKPAPLLHVRDAWAFGALALGWVALLVWLL